MPARFLERRNEAGLAENDRNTGGAPAEILARRRCEAETEAMSQTAMPMADGAARREREPRWFRTVFSIVERIEIGALEFELPDGRVFRAAGETPGPEGRIRVHDERMFGRMVRDGGLGFAEAYIDGWWSSPDLQAVLDAALLNNENVARELPENPLSLALNRFRHWLNRNTRLQAKRNIEAHYDLGNEFYGLWLDPSMTYSSGLFQTPEASAGQSLEDAQRAKYRSICDRMALRQGDHVLEIGCGWGGFAEYAAREVGARVTAITISREQHEFARRRIHEAGLAERVDIRLVDYRDVEGRFDRIASIEMFEAVGEQYWDAYFATLRRVLKPGGRAGLQIITIRDDLFEGYRRRPDFIQKYVFPGGMLPSEPRLAPVIAGAGLDWDTTERFGQDYAATLERWSHRFDDAWPAIAAGGRFDDRFRRLWRFYLAYCEAGFRSGRTDVIQIGLAARTG